MRIGLNNEQCKSAMRMILSVQPAHSVCRSLLFDFADCNVYSHDSQDELVLYEEHIKQLLGLYPQPLLASENHTELLAVLRAR